VSLGINTVDKQRGSTSSESPPNKNKFEYADEFKKKIENNQMLYSLANIGLIRAKTRTKISFKCTLKQLTQTFSTSFFYWITASINPSRFPTDTSCSQFPMSPFNSSGSNS
jgi:hypothetical protein